MTVDQMIQLVFGAGFPAGVAVYLLMRLGPVLEKMTTVMTRVEKALDQIDERQAEKEAAPTAVDERPTVPLKLTKSSLR